MRHSILKTFTICFVAVCVAYVSQLAIAAPMKTTERESGDYSRDCMLAAGGWTVVDCSAAAAYSGALTAKSRYLFQSTGDDTYLSFHSAASGGDADANDLDLDDSKVVPFVIKAGALYATCLGTTNASKIKYIECQ